MMPKGWSWGVVVVCLGLAAGPARAEMYQYKDDQGSVHFVDSMGKVPPQYRKQLGAEYNPDANREESGSRPQALSPAEPPRQGPQAEGAAAPVREQRERLREIKRQGCATDRERLGKRLKELEAQNAEWSAKKKAEGRIGESTGSIYCPGGNANLCVEEHEKHEAEEESKRFAESPYRTQIETVRGQLDRLKRECRE